jgi:hypothetical protein
MLGPPKPRRLDQPIAVSLEALVPRGNVYRHLEAKFDLSFVRDWTRELYAERGRPAIDPEVGLKLHLIMCFERMPSKNITSCSLKKITGSMLGRPRSAYSSRLHSRTKLRSSFVSRRR